MKIKNSTFSEQPPRLDLRTSDSNTLDPQGDGKCNQGTVKIIQPNFDVDDGLASVNRGNPACKGSQGSQQYWEDLFAQIHHQQQEGDHHNSKGGMY